MVDCTPPGAVRRRRLRRIRPTERAAREALRDLLIQAQRAGALETPAVTLGAWLDEWLRDGQWRPSTRRSYEQTVADHIRPYLAGVPLAQLKPSRLKAWMQDLLDAGRTPATVRYARAVLRSALSAAVELYDLPGNPAERVSVPSHTPRERRPFTLAELDRLVRASPPWLAVYLLVVFALGLRRGEGLGLQWEDLDWRAGTITIARTLYEDRTVGPPKTDAGRRTTPAPPAVWQALAAHRRRVELEAVAIGRPVAPWIWASRTGGPLSPRNVERAYYAARARAGLPATLRLHDLRHGAATELVRRGVPLSDVGALLGHADTRTTLIYDHATGERLLRAAQLMQRALPPPPHEGAD